MTRPLDHPVLPLVAAGLGTSAGVAEIVVGTAGWVGNKNDPTTLGAVTIGLAVVLGTALWVATHHADIGIRLGAALVAIAIALVGTTTAGLAWTPAAVVGFTAGSAHAWRARGRGAWHRFAERWPDVLLVALAVVYLAFGIVAGDARGLLGIGGALAVFATVARHDRGQRAAAAALVLGALPFAVVTWWTVVVPLTAVLMLAIGLPHVLVRTGGRS